MFDESCLREGNQGQGGRRKGVMQRMWRKKREREKQRALSLSPLM